MEDDLAFVTFDLYPTSMVPFNAEVLVPQAVFVLAANSGEVLAARVVEPGATQETLLVHDILASE